MKKSRFERQKLCAVELMQNTFLPMLMNDVNLQNNNNNNDGKYVYIATRSHFVL